MTDTTTCQTCGTTIDTARSEGVCAICLFGDALDQEMSEMFGGHELHGVIARGGMGVVYRAMQKEPRREVALKTLRGAELDSPEAQTRFRDEARTMAGLDHPGILPIHQFGQQDGVLFFTMKLAAGGTLAERTADYAGAWRKIATLMIEVADAVQFAHEHGVLHRDLKPGNILFDEEDHAYVSDFGLAKIAERVDGGLTASAAMLGTPHYMAPEIAAHGLRAATTVTDVWSLGVVLYELLAQTRPFKSDSVPALMLEIAEREPGVMPANVPADLRVITRKTLEKSAARRYASARELAADLRRWLGGLPILARRVSAAERLVLWMRRRPERAALSALVVLSIVMAIISLIWGLKRAREETEKANAARDEGRLQLREALVGRARSTRIAGQSGWRAQGLTALRDAAAIRNGVDVRSEAIAHLVGLDLELTDFAKLPHGSVPTADFALFASCSAKAADAVEVSFMDFNGKRQGAPVSFDCPVASTARFELTFDATGQRLVVQMSGGGVVLVDVTARRVVRQWLQGASGGFTDDGRLLVVLVHPHLVGVFHAEDGGDEGELPCNPKSLVGWHLCRIQPGDDSALMVLVEDKRLEIWNWREKRKVSERKSDEPPSRIAWWGDLLVAEGSGTFQITLWNLRSGRAHFMSNDDSFPSMLTFSPDGRFLAVASESGSTASLWDTATGQRLWRSGDVLPVAFSRDGHRFLHAGAMHSEVGTVQRSEAVRTVDVSSLCQGLAFMDFSPDGRWLLCNSRALSESRTTSGCLSILEVETLRPVCVSTLFTAAAAVRFIGDSRHIIGLKARYGDTDALLRIYCLADAGGVMSLEDGRDIISVDLNKHPGLESSPDRHWIALGGKGDVMLVDTHDPASVPAARSMPQGEFDTWLHSGVWSGATTLPANEITAGWPPPLLSPDGRLIAKADAQRLRVADAASSVALHTHVLAPHAGRPAPLAWSPDNHTLVFTADRQDASLVDAKTGVLVAALAGPRQNAITALQFSPDGRSIALLRDAGVLEVWDVGKIAEDLAALGISWELPLPVKSAPQGIKGTIKTAALRRLYIP